MKKIVKILGVIAAVALCGFSATAQITGPVFYNSYDANLSFFIGNTSTPAADDGTVFFQIFAGGNPLTPSGAGSTSVNLIAADAPFFDYGVAYTGQANDATGVAFRIEAWKGAPGSTFASSVGVTPTAELNWTQTVGNQPAVGTPTALPLTFGGASSLVLTVVPEPATITLGILGGVAILARRRREQSI
ncbi:MAG: PEP-CTERM sorting domain-containing protein [Verrucomicrobia bacterium]|nr:PEP-CTERM sorting domain-containing protein [Verrucomicrobiota bacterium]